MRCSFIYMVMVLLTTTIVSVKAQQPETEVQGALEELAEQTDQEVENDDMWQQLQAYRHRRLNLNTATADALQVFPFLNARQIQSILQYKKLLGNFISIYELQAVPGLDLKTIQLLLPYVFTGDKNPFGSSYKLKDFFHKGNWEVLLRYKRNLENARGFLHDSMGKTHYLGDPNALFFRIRYQFPQHLSMGVTADRDAGEPFTGRGQHGMDFYAFHFFLKDYKNIKALAIGDYNINLGQGLINRQGLTFGKSSMVMQTDRSGPAIRPHTSAMEYGFYRGAAVSLNSGKFNTTLFVSYKPEDANIIPLDSAHGYFKGFQSSGYHRSENELEDKGAVKLFSGGGSIRYSFGKGHIALNAVYHKFSDSMRHADQLYDLYGATGEYLLNASIDYALFFRKLYFFGETAIDKHDAVATVNGLLMSVDPHVDISLLYRHYAPSYTSLYARAFGEGTEPKNENGFYLGLLLRPKTHWQVNLYGDIFQFPWLKYRVDEPAQGAEYFAEITYEPSKRMAAYIRYRYKQKPLNLLDGDRPMAKVVGVARQNLRANIQWTLSDYISLRERGELTCFNKEKSNNGYGYYIGQDLLWKTNKCLSGNARVAWFHTNDYDTRIYAYENDVRFAYSIPFLYGKGIRSYVNLRVNIGKAISLWAKLSRTWYFDQETIGSGWDEIKGNKRTNLTVEMIWTP